MTARRDSSAACSRRGSTTRIHTGAHPCKRASMQAGLRRAATGLLGGLFPTPLYRLRPAGVPSCRIQDFIGRLFPTRLYHLHPVGVSINDSGAPVRHLSGMAKGLSGWRQTHSDPVVIPAKAGIQERGPGSAGMAGFIGCPCPVVVTIVIPAPREWMV